MIRKGNYITDVNVPRPTDENNVSCLAVSPSYLTFNYREAARWPMQRAAPLFARSLVNSFFLSCRQRDTMRLVSNAPIRFIVQTLPFRTPVPRYVQVHICYRIIFWLLQSIWMSERFSNYLSSLSTRLSIGFFFCISNNDGKCSKRTKWKTHFLQKAETEFIQIRSKDDS